METKPEHYFSPDPTSKIVKRIIHIEVTGTSFDLMTSSGLFSPEHIDVGSQALIEFSRVEHGAHVLDLGSGYGVIGIACLLRDPSIKMVFSDVNPRAVEFTHTNLTRFSLPGDAIISDGFAAVPGQFDTILFNPPQSAGKEVCFRMFGQAFDHLVIGGTLQIVVRKNKGGGSYSVELERLFGNVELVGVKKGFGVYIATKV